MRDAEAVVRRNKRLMTIVSDLDVAFDSEGFRLSGYDNATVRRIFEELEFRSLLRELEQLGEASPTRRGVGAAPVVGEEMQVQNVLFPDLEPPATLQPDTGAVGVHPYLCIQTESDLALLLEGLNSAEILSFDVETTGTDPMSAGLVGLGIAWAGGGGCYIPVSHSRGEQLPWERVRAAVQPYFARADLPKVAHNAKYDLVVCRRHGLDIAGPIHDTMTVAWLLESASRALGLKSQADKELGWTMTEITALIGTGRNQISIGEADIEAVTAYCGADVDATIQLWEALTPRLRDADMWKLYEEIELPLLPVLADMEMAGILLNTDFLADLSRKLAKRLQEIDRCLKDIVGHEFNLRSTQQLSAVMFKEMDFPARGLKRRDPASSAPLSASWKSCEPRPRRCLLNRASFSICFLSSANWKSCAAPMWMLSANWYTAKRAACIPAITRQAPPPAASAAATQTCKTFPFERSRAGRCARRLKRRLAISCWRRTTAR